MKMLGWFITVIVAGYAGMCMLLFLKQRSLLYYPTPPIHPPLVGAQPIELVNDGETLLAWRFPGTEPGRALLYFGGNAEQVALNGPVFSRLFPQWTIYLINYRGYGGSSGSPSEAGLLSDAEAFYDLVCQDHRRIAVMGRSLGTGIAVHLASVRPVERLILVTPYDSMIHLASTYYPWIPVSMLLRDRYDSASKADQLDIPVQVLIAGADEVIPGTVSGALIARLSPDRTQVLTVDGAGHNTIDSYSSYSRSLTDFMRD